MSTREHHPHAPQRHRPYQHPHRRRRAPFHLFLHLSRPQHHRPAGPMKPVISVLASAPRTKDVWFTTLEPIIATPNPIHPLFGQKQVQLPPAATHPRCTAHRPLLDLPLLCRTSSHTQPWLVGAALLGLATGKKTVCKATI